MSVAILIPTYSGYRWLAPLMQRRLAEFWPNHPPVHFCGLTPLESCGLPVLPLAQSGEPRDWLAFVRDAAAQLREAGFDKCYLLLEEHQPLAPCHEEHLNVTLPRFLDELLASYIGLMGWDNRRIFSKGRVLGDKHRLRHLDPRERGPRFHLHPALWRIDALLACLDLALAEKIHSTWRFERLVAAPDAPLQEDLKRGCYLVCGAAIACRTPSAMGTLVAGAREFMFRKLKALHPRLPKPLQQPFWRWVGFDNFYFNGPYPMFYSGVMSKGGLNPYFVRFMQRDPARRARLDELLAAKERFEESETP